MAARKSRAKKVTKRTKRTKKAGVIPNHPPFTSETAPRNGGRPKGSIGIKAMLKAALEQPQREGEKPAAQVAAEGIVRKAKRSADFALKAFDYVDPRTNVVTGELDIAGPLEDRLIDALDGILAEGGKANGAQATPGERASGDTQLDPARSGNGSA